MLAVANTFTHYDLQDFNYTNKNASVKDVDPTYGARKWMWSGAGAVCSNIPSLNDRDFFLRTTPSNVTAEKNKILCKKWMGIGPACRYSSR